jgi:hypothetical protein
VDGEIVVADVEDTGEGAQTRLRYGNIADLLLSQFRSGGSCRDKRWVCFCSFLSVHFIME